jgi:hypothetical protein
MGYAEITVDGMTEADVRYNIYAFGQDMKRCVRKFERARTDKSRMAWSKRVLEAERALKNNERRRAQFAEMSRGRAMLSQVQRLAYIRSIFERDGMQAVRGQAFNDSDTMLLDQVIEELRQADLCVRHGVEE